MYINKLLRDTMFYYYSFGINMTTNIKMLITRLYYIYLTTRIYIFRLTFFILNIINCFLFRYIYINIISKKKKKNDSNNITKKRYVQ